MQAFPPILESLAQNCSCIKDWRDSEEDTLGVVREDMRSDCRRLQLQPDYLRRRAPESAPAVCGLVGAFAVSAWRQAAAAVASGGAAQAADGVHLQQGVAVQ